MPIAAQNPRLIMGPIPPTSPSAAQPNLRLKTPRPNAPEPGYWNISAVTQDVDGPVRHLRGKAEVEGTSLLFRADEIDYNTDTGDLAARGNVYYKNFDRNEEIWCDRMEYNTEEETGKFYNVRGKGQPHIEARPGVLTSASPFFFQGVWAERKGNHYLLYDGFVTNCKMPKPWWRLRGPRFDIAPNDRAIAYRTRFLVRKFPLFFSPFFYKSLQKVPRRSGFLTPNIGNSSQYGKMIGIGYFWAINRSYDVTYQVQDFTERGFAHHVDLRGKPGQRTDFDAVFYGVQDRGLEQPDGTLLKQGGATLYVAGKSDLGNGFYFRGVVNYLSSFRFRQAFTQSYNEAIFSEVHSVGFITKSWSSYTFNAIFARLENFQSSEIAVTEPGTNNVKYEANSVVIRKLPEVELSSRDRQPWSRLPVWVSFQSAAGLLYRTQPVFEGNSLIDRYQTGQFMNRANLEPRVTTAFHVLGIHLVPSFAIHETYYGESQQPYQDRYQVIGTNLVRSARDFSTDLIFPTLERIFTKKTIFGDKLKHVIEPRATYRYVSGIGTDFNRFIRFDETDLLSDTNEIELSLTNRIYAKRGETVTEIFSWQLWQKRYFDPTFGGAVVPGRRNVVESSIDLTPYAFLDGPRSVSPVVSVLRASPILGLGMEWRADYDTTRGGIANSTFSADYRWKHYFISVGHNQVRTDPVLTPSANQLRWFLGFGDPNHRGLNAGFTAIYDYRQGVMQYATTQVTYNTDCCGLSVQFRRFNFGTRNENQFRVAFAVANIGTFGTLKKQERMF